MTTQQVETLPRIMMMLQILYFVVKYVIDMKHYGLKIEPVIEEKEKRWNLVAFLDSDYAGDPDSRKSVSGYVIYLCGVPISWRSRAQKTVTLSSAEAEWIALSEVAKEVIFISQVLQCMGVNILYPITI